MGQLLYPKNSCLKIFDSNSSLFLSHIAERIVCWFYVVFIFDIFRLFWVIVAFMLFILSMLSLFFLFLRRRDTRPLQMVAVMLVV